MLFVKFNAFYTFWISQELLLSAIVHDYFFDMGVPESADMISSASEPVLLFFYYHITFCINVHRNLCKICKNLQKRKLAEILFIMLEKVRIKRHTENRFAER